jgi:hypothetical protein
MALRFFAKLTFEIFQKEALASGEVAIATSPIPPARASGEIRKNGTAVDTMLIESACAIAVVQIVDVAITAQKNFVAVLYVA